MTKVFVKLLSHNYSSVYWVSHHGVAVSTMATTNHHSDFGDGGTRYRWHQWTLSLQMVTVHLCLEETDTEEIQIWNIKMSLRAPFTSFITFFRRCYFSYSLFEPILYRHFILSVFKIEYYWKQKSKKWQNCFIIYFELHAFKQASVCVFHWEWIPELRRVLVLLLALCSGGRGGGCLSGHTTGQNGFLSRRPGMTARRCWLLFPPGG